MQRLLYRIESVIGASKLRLQGDPIADGVFTADMMNDFEGISTWVFEESAVNVSELKTIEIVTTVFKVINYIHDRRNLSDDAVLRDNAAKIILLINDLLTVLDNPNYMRTFEAYQENEKCVVGCLKSYRETLTYHPLLPFDAWILSPEYEIALKCFLYDKTSHYLLQRIKAGYQYGDGLKLWCGSSKLKFNFELIDVGRYEDVLARYLPAQKILAKRIKCIYSLCHVGRSSSAHKCT